MSGGTATWFTDFFHGWKELALLFVVLLLVALVMGWLANRKARPSERAAALNVPLFLAAFALLLVVKHLRAEPWSALIIAMGLALGGLISARSGTRAPVLLTLQFGVLLGFGLHLSAVVLFIAAALLLILSRPATHDKRSAR